jgi:nucleotide-binding universal stress UspA family protein
VIKRILVALSGTPFTPSAVKHALELARAHSAEVTGVTIVDTARLADVGPVPIGGGAAAHALAEHRIQVTEERVETTIADFEAACRAAGAAYTVDRETGDAMERLIDLWRFHDLLVFGLRGLFEYGVVHRPDNEVTKLIAKGVRPILAVAQEHRPIRRVLAAINGSLESSNALKRFVQSRPYPDVTLKLACFGLDDDEASDLLAAAGAYCRSHGLEPEAESVAGYPREGLLKHAHHWKADLVVMGSTSRSRLAKLILGDTVLEAMRSSDLPLYLAQ